MNQTVTHYTEKFKRLGKNSFWPSEAAIWIEGIGPLATDQEKLAIWENVQDHLETGTPDPAWSRTEDLAPFLKSAPATQTEIPDELNPDHLFSTTWTELLLKIASGVIDCRELAKEQLDQRGLDHQTGKWIGFKNSNK